MNMDVLCSNRSQEVLKEYGEIRSVVRILSEGREIEILKLLDLLDQLQQNWNVEKLRVKALEKELNAKEEDTIDLRKELRMCKEQLRDARAQVAALMSDKQGMEHDIAEMERKFELVSELLKDQPLLSEQDRQKLLFSGNTVSRKWTRTRRGKRSAHLGVSCGSSDGEGIDYDKTADSLADSSDDLEESRLRNGKVYRRSHSMVSLSGKRSSTVAVKRTKKSVEIDTVEEEVETPCKRQKGSIEQRITTPTAVTVDSEYKKPCTAKIAVRRSMNRSMSATDILDKTEGTITPLTAKTLTPRQGISTVDLRTPLTGTKTWTRGASIETRPHTFANCSSLLGEHCAVCKGWIGIAGKPAFKCCDCGMHIHKACTDDAPFPCVPRTPTPRTPGKRRPRLRDFCPSMQPMIPPIIIHCILALEKDRLSSEGIYRIPGDEAQVQKLLNEFLNGRSVPNLGYHDTETITSCIKQFLRKLRDPVIPTTSWEEFVCAAEKEDVETLNQSIMDLPYPNRDTLAFLCAHFQKVCDNCIRNKMPLNVLARCVAATIVGPAPLQILKADEDAKQVMVMLALLRMPRDYWPKFYNFDKELPLIKNSHCSPYRNDKAPSKTPYKNPNKSILGPVDTPPSGYEGKVFQPPSSRKKRLLGDLF